jgi:uncharacterized protein YecE (DUF72 family)
LRKGRLWIGTSGYRYWPGDVFPPKTSTDEALRLYAQALPALEVNRTFYQLPRASSIEKWLSIVPSNFAFAVKIWRRVSHEKKLLGIEKDWPLFLDRLAPLLARNGVCLLQLSKSFPQDLHRLEYFLKSVPRDVRLAIEFRHTFWFSQPVYTLLKRYGVALVGVSAPGVPCVLDVRMAPFAYFRLHGPRAWYKDRYTLHELSPFLSAARAALVRGDVYVFFDNTIGGHAYWNALEFMRKVL